MSKVHVETTINDEAAEFLCEPNQSLLEVLRDTLGLTGTKEGCSTGDCGRIDDRAYTFNTRGDTSVA